MNFLAHILLVAWREYKTTAKTRSFILTLLIIPIILGGSAAFSAFTARPAGTAYVLVDATGRYGPAFEAREQLDYQRSVLSHLSDYAGRWSVRSYLAGTPLATERRWFDDGDVTAFVKAGGAPSILTRIKPHLPADAPAFDYPTQWQFSVAAPAGVPTGQGPGAFGTAIKPWLHKDLMTSSGPRPLATAIYIPADFSPGHPVAQVWSDGRPDSDFLGELHDQLTNMLRVEALRGDGLTPPQIAEAETLAPRFDVAAPPPGAGGGEMVLIRSALPIALSYLLFMSIMASGTKMLLGTIEERSNKLLESILACIDARQLMYGKLIGVVGLGLTAVAVWAACAVGAAYSFHGELADFLRPALSSLQSPWAGAGLVLYFICGYVMIAMILLAVGSVSNSIQDAQGYLQPLMMVLLVPYILMVSTMVRDPHSIIVEIMSWIPLYTPFAMLARLGSGVPVWEIIGTTVIMVAFVIFELWWLGRVFRDNLLNTGQPPKLLGFMKRKPRVQ
jgi:ABC-type Na+ efflux pump permease subunit